MKLESPMNHIYDNLMITKTNQVWAYYKVPLSEMNNRNREKQESYKKKQELFFEGLAKYKDIHISINPMSMNLSDRFNEFSKEYDENFEDLAKDFERKSKRMIERELGVLTKESFIIGVRLDKLSTAKNIKEKISESYDLLASNFLGSVGYSLQVDEEFISRYRLLEEVLFQQFGMMNGRKLSRSEMYQMYHYHFVRGTKKSFELNQESTNIFNLTDTQLNTESHPGIIEMRSQGEVKYASILPVPNFKTNMRFNHCVELSQELPFPVELQVRAHFEPLKGMGSIKGKSDRAYKNLKATGIEALNGGDSESNKGKMGRFILKDLEDKLDNKVPIIKWFACFTVFGDTVEQCLQRSNSVIHLMETVGVELVTASADQMMLFYYLLPGANASTVTNWLHYTTVQGLSEMMIGTDNRIGDNIGFPIGRVSTISNVNGKRLDIIARSSRKVVFYHPFLASEQVLGKVSDSPHIAITGPTGGGKSFLAKFLFVFSSLMKGKGLYVDPKSEFKKWVMRVIENEENQRKYPEFINYLKQYHFVKLDPDNKENWGVLDPICFLTGSDAKDTAESIFDQIYDFTSKEDAKISMLRGIKKVISEREKGEKVGLMHVIDYMKSSDKEECVSAGEALFEIIDGSALQLAFSYGDSKGLNLTNKVTVLEVSGLKLPKATDNPDNFSTVQKKSIALMLPLGKFCEQFGMRDYSEHTYVSFDEAWIFTVTRGGAEVLNAMRKVGRSQNNQLILITQSINDVNTEDESGNFGRIFAFDKSDERELILKHMGLEVSESNLEWLANTPTRHCLYKDLYGHVGRMLVYCPFKELVELFRTVEETSGGSSEEKFAV